MDERIYVNTNWYSNIQYMYYTKMWYGGHMIIEGAPIRNERFLKSSSEQL